MDAYQHAADQLRLQDRDRFVADLFAPESARRHLFALHAFDAEIARIRFVVSESALGEIRLQWWRDALAGRDSGGNPVAEALLRSIETEGWPVPAFLALLDARIFDLYNDPMPSLTDFEGYAGETSSVLFQFAAVALGAAGPAAVDASGHGGVAWALTAALGRFAADAERHQLFLPRDRMENHGVDIEDVFALRTSPQLVAAIADLRQIAAGHFARARAAVANLPGPARAAFLPLALARSDLARLERTAADPFARPPPSPRWRRQWLIWRAARRGLR
jgi:phytoene synthase